ncbi:pentatricopeptide repeat-containing protein [Prunus yedoensis var. nudiflora]|uniref:Pentatricopeptide repeat-containing protein n=1 Tax=Prunus yedoensis var. nudiflora TaxID=2094558 RepID=A0A314XLH2_PRUYE|nr:pentatricopeptide repeat-containing protein [Prunus yedoensis var. nudiflora]
MNTAEQLCVSLLSKCKTLKTVKQVHAFVCKTGLDAHPLVSGKLLLHCAVTISGALEYARRLLLHFRNPDAFMYNTLIRGSLNLIPRTMRLMCSLKCTGN